MKKERNSMGITDSIVDSSGDLFSEHSNDRGLVARPEWCHDLWSFGMIVTYISLAQSFQEKILLEIPDNEEIADFMKSQIFPKLEYDEVELINYCLFDACPYIEDIKEMKYFEDVSWTYLLSKPIIPKSNLQLFVPPVKPLMMSFGSGLGSQKRRRGGTFHFLDAVKSLSSSDASLGQSKELVIGKGFTSRISLFTKERIKVGSAASKDLDVF